MSRKVRERLTFANVVSVIALFAALGGGAMAALAKNSVKAKQIAANAVRAAEIKDGEVKGAEVDEGSLGKVASAQSADSAGTAGFADTAATANSAQQAENASNAQNAQNAAQLGGVAAGSYLQEDCTTAASQQPGKVNGFARVRGRAEMPSTYSSADADVDADYNCAGPAVQVRRVGVGQYYVRFPGNGSIVAVATPRLSSAGTGVTVTDQTDNHIAVGHAEFGNDAGSFLVTIRDSDGTTEEGTFHIVVL
jgi:hypothetical protein